MRLVSELSAGRVGSACGWLGMASRCHWVVER
jgi:hypothetical protein